MSGMVDRYHRWFEYEKDAHEKVLASLHAVPHNFRGLDSFQKAVALFAHIVAARWLWLFRFGFASNAPSDLFPQTMVVEDLSELAAAMHTAWDAYFARVDEGELAHIFEYQSLEGPKFRSRVEDILTQLFGHSWYHRGQIAQLIRSIGCEPAATDFVFWTREPIEEGHEDHSSSAGE